MSTENVYSALFKFQGLVRGVKRDAKNPHFKNSYATLEAVTDTIRPHMQECGLVWIQTPGGIVDSCIMVTTRIHHPASNTHHEGTIGMPLAKRDPQGAGSALTYAMRYSLMAILGLPPTDDDGEAAIDRNDERPAIQEPPKSSASLKREGSWDTLKAELDADLADCHSNAGVARLRADYRAKAIDMKWPKAWLASLAEIFDQKEDELRAGQTVNAIKNEFPGARVVDERNEYLENMSAG